MKTVLLIAGALFLIVFLAWPTSKNTYGMCPDIAIIDKNGNSINDCPPTESRGNVFGGVHYIYEIAQTGQISQPQAKWWDFYCLGGACTETFHPGRAFLAALAISGTASAAWLIIKHKKNGTKKST